MRRTTTLNKLLAVVAGLSFCLPSVAVDETGALVENGKFISKVRVTGKVVPGEGSMYVQAARVSGRLVELLKKEGELVTVGTPLFKISSAECTSLAEERRVAQERGLKDLEAAVARREHQLDVFLSKDECLLLASRAGTITKRFLELGANFNIGDALAHIVNTKRLTVELEIPEKDSSKISVGHKVTVHLASDPESDYPAKIQTLVPALDPATRTTKARVSPLSFVRPPNLEAFVIADIDIDTPEQNLIVPTISLVFHQNRQWVLKMISGKPPSPVAVEVLNDEGDRTAIRPLPGNQLAAGDRVMTKGAVFAFKQLRSEGI